jgi:hypothetical protein
MNNVDIKQVEETKLPWSKHIDATVAKMGRGLSIIKHCSAFLSSLSIKISPTAPSFVTTASLDY